MSTPYYIATPSEMSVSTVEGSWLRRIGAGNDELPRKKKFACDMM